MGRDFVVATDEDDGNRPITISTTPPYKLCPFLPSLSKFNARIVACWLFVNASFRSTVSVLSSFLTDTFFKLKFTCNNKKLIENKYF